jgi:Na+/melibiose symporter and related transporters
MLGATSSRFWSSSSAGPIPETSWAFSLTICCLGLSAAWGGINLARIGPRKLAVAGGLLFAAGYALAAVALAVKSLTLFYLGYGAVAGNRHRPRLRHADEHRHQVVPRQEGTGDRHCRHGVWARRLHPQRRACPDPDARVPPEPGPCVRSPGRHPRLGRLRLRCDAEGPPGRLSPERLCPVSSEGCPRGQPLCQGRGRVRPAA